MPALAAKKLDLDRYARLGQAEIAAIHGVTARAVRDWNDQGIPRNEDGTYNAAATVEWRLHRDVHGGLNLEAERAKLASAQAQKAELDLAERRGDLLARADVVRTWAGHCAAVRDRMRSIPTKLAPMISTPGTTASVAAQIRAYIDEALNELAGDDFGADAQSSD